MKYYSTKISGIAPLLVNRFHEGAEEAVSGGGSIKTIRTKGKLLPYEDAKQRLYTDDKGKPIVPGVNVLACLTSAGRFIKAGRRSLSTMKESLVPAFVSILEGDIHILPGKWETDSRPVVIPATQGRIMRHRPRFDAWSLEFTVGIIEGDELHPDVVRQLLDEAGQKVGLGDFRPNKRGPFGRFRVDSWEFMKN